MTLKQLLGIILGFLILVLLIFAVVMMVRTKFFPTKKVVTSNTTRTDSIPSVPVTQSAQPLGNTGSVNDSGVGSLKIYQIDNVSFRYLNNWGLLTCTNSRNFEFDPINASNQKITCDRAVKPITVLVDNSLGCTGDQINLGGTVVTKSRVENARGVDYRWCFSAGSHSFNLTHRVSPTVGQGLGKDDFSAQIEQMISRIAQQGGGS